MENKLPPQMISNEDIENQFAISQKIKQILLNKYPEHLPTAFVHSFGCQQNTTDGEKIKGLLATMGYGFTDTHENADIIIYNTCAIRENAEDRVFGNIGELKHIKASRPDTIICLCGCMMQEQHVVDRILRSYPQIDIIFGTHVVHELPSIIHDFLSSKKRVVNAQNSTGIIAENIPVVRTEKFKASVPIMYGCNNFCSYCIVPYVRGRERSRLPHDILKEINTLVKDGCKEITLLGQNVNSYGLGLDDEINFSKLLKLISDIDGDFRIRFMTSHPKDATFELIDTIRDCNKVCKHIHLPVQSGSNRILDLMNRKYTVESYMSLIKYAREQIPEISFTTDLIVGFPSENYEDFLETENLVKEIGFDSLFTFIFSKREGTAAEKMLDPIPYSEKSKWFTQLLKTQKNIGENKYKDYIGKTVRILVDGVGKVYDNCLTGRTDNFVIVDFKGDKNLIGEFVDVKITKALNWALLGEII